MPCPHPIVPIENPTLERTQDVGRDQVETGRGARGTQGPARVCPLHIRDVHPMLAEVRMVVVLRCAWLGSFLIGRRGVNLPRRSS